jgi:hypothetical protein
MGVVYTVFIAVPSVLLILLHSTTLLFNPAKSPCTADTLGDVYLNVYNSCIAATCVFSLAMAVFYAPYTVRCHS